MRIPALPVLAALAVAAALLVATLPARISPVDGGELAAVAHTLGIAHPTGYPLWTSVARLAAAVPIGPSLSWRLALLSALEGIAALALLAPLFAGAGRARPAARTVKSPADPLSARLLPAALLLLASSISAFLAAARSAEVYALSLLFFAALLRLAHEAGARRISADRAILLGAYLVGLGSGVHMTLLLAVPALLYLGVRATRCAETWALAVALAALGRSVYAFLPIRSACEPPLDWGNPETLHAFLSHTLAWQYRVWMFESADAAVKNLSAFASEAWRGFSVLLLLAPLGLARLARRAPRALHASLLLFLGFLAYTMGYSIHDIAIYFLPINLVIVFWIAEGAAWTLDRIRRSAGARAEGARAAVAPVLLALILVPAALSWRTHAGRERAEAEVATSYARAILEPLPPRAIVLSRFWDLVVSPSIELQLVERVRADVTVLDQEHFRRSWYAPLLRRTAPDLAPAARRETDAFLALLAPFEAGKPFDRARIQAAYERMIFTILNADTTRPLFATIDVEPALVAPYRSEPWGLAMRLVRPGETPPALYAGTMPSWSAATRAAAGKTGDMAAEIAGEMAAANATRALALGDTALARRRLAEALLLGRGASPRALAVRSALQIPR